MKITEMLLTNKDARPRIALNKVKGIVVHYVGNPNTSAKNNRNYWETGVSAAKKNWASAHDIIDLDGGVVRCIPHDEMAYHVGHSSYAKEAVNRLGSYPNNCTIGIECTHLDWNGVMSEATYNTLVDLCVDLLKRHGLSSNDLWLHKEVTNSKDCHKYFVLHPDKWTQLKREVQNKLDGVDELAMEEKQLLKDLNATVKDLIQEVHGIGAENKELKAKLDSYKNQEVSAWAKEWIDKAVTKGIVKGDEYGHLNPKEPLNLERMMTFLGRMGLLK